MKIRTTINAMMHQLSSMQQVAITYSEINNDISDLLFQQLLCQIPDRQREGILKFKFRRDAQASLFGKLLLNDMLFRMYGNTVCLQDIQYTTHNRPYIGLREIDFNISHSGSYVVCVLGQRMKVGIDIEKLNPIDFSDFKNVFADHEWAQINEAGNSLRAFYSLWTQKEALVKANGKGLSVPLQDVVIGDGKAQIDKEYWYLTEIPISNGYSCNLATNISLQDPVKMTRLNLIDELRK